VQGARFRVLVINPGSATTKFAVYLCDKPQLVRNISHTDAEMAPFRGRPILDQIDFRQSTIERVLLEEGAPLNGFDAVVGRGGLTRGLPSGTYRVNQEILEDLRLARYGEHASNLGAFLAQRLAARSGCGSFVVDPVGVDEWSEVARISGSALVERHLLCHALNTKAVARRYAREHGEAYSNLRLVVAHLGSGISISAHQGGRMVDANNAGSEGTFSTERSGGLPLLKVIQLCYSGRYTEDELWNLLNREGGIYSYLGTKDLREVEERIAAGDTQARLIFDAMIYQVAKDIGQMATVLGGHVDAILLTGGMAHSSKLVAQLKDAIAWIAPITVYPGEDELQALAEGALRVLKGEEEARELIAQV
jgi:butyrate kinase